MTKSEIRALEERVARALRWADRRLGQTNHYDVRPMPADERNGDTVRTSVTQRGKLDPACFVVEFDPDIVEATSLRNLRILAGHESLHAMLWPLGASASREDPIVYRLQRAIFGEVRE